MDEIDKVKEHINMLGRFSCENNLRLLNYKESPNENVFEIVLRVLGKIGLPNAEIIKAHRTGKISKRTDLLKANHFQFF